MADTSPAVSTRHDATPRVSVTIPELLATFDELGERPWLVTPTDRLTYAAANRESADLARTLLARGVGKNTRVAIVLANGADWVVTCLAVTRIGAHAILLNPFAKGPELAYALRHSDAAAVITGTATGGADAAALLSAAVPELAGHQHERALFATSHPYLRAVWWRGGGAPTWADDPLAGPRASGDLLAEVESEVHPSDPMITSYTSGTTAQPKAVVHSHGAILRQAEKLAARRRITGDDRLYTPMPMFWVGGLAFVLLSAATRGALVATDARFDAGRALDLLERHRVTAVYCWPQAAEAIATHPSFRSRDLSALRAGPPILRGPEWANVAADQREQSLGMTETCGPHTYSFDPDAILPEHLRGSFGPPVENMEHRIVDPDTGEQLPDGEVGELLVRGECLMLGFHKRERQDTFDADGWYHTGDLCSWREGRLFFHGRRGDMIKTAGFNVAPAEVEAALEALDDVVYSVVLGVPDPVREQAVAALVAVRPGSGADAASLRAALAERISSYKVPTRWRIVSVEEFPMAITGKADRARARALLDESTDLATT